MMIRLVILLTSVTISASTLPTAASQCEALTAIAANRTHWAAVRSQFNKATDREAACRAYAVSFYETVTTRHAAARCTGDADITALDSEVNAFNELLATRCGG